MNSDGEPRFTLKFFSEIVCSFENMEFFLDNMVQAVDWVFIFTDGFSEFSGIFVEN